VGCNPDRFYYAVDKSKIDFVRMDGNGVCSRKDGINKSFGTIPWLAKIGEGGRIGTGKVKYTRIRDTLGLAELEVPRPLKVGDKNRIHVSILLLRHRHLHMGRSATLKKKNYPSGTYTIITKQGREISCNKHGS
jgi:hypothetical protein